MSGAELHPGQTHCTVSDISTDIQGALRTAFPHLIRPPERRSHGYFEGNMQILRVCRAMQVVSLTTDYPTIPILSQMYFKLKFLQH
jgi:hypothetical protein